MKLMVSKEKDLIELIRLLSTNRPETSIVIVTPNISLLTKISRQLNPDYREGYDAKLTYFKYRDCNVVCFSSNFKYSNKYYKIANFIIELDFDIEELYNKRIIQSIELQKHEDETHH